LYLTRFLLMQFSSLKPSEFIFAVTWKYLNGANDNLADFEAFDKATPYNFCYANNDCYFL